MFIFMWNEQPHTKCGRSDEATTLNFTSITV